MLTQPPAEACQPSTRSKSSTSPRKRSAATAGAHEHAARIAVPAELSRCDIVSRADTEAFVLIASRQTRAPREVDIRGRIADGIERVGQRDAGIADTRHAAIG